MEGTVVWLITYFDNKTSEIEIHMFDNHFIQFNCFLVNTRRDQTQVVFLVSAFSRELFLSFHIHLKTTFFFFHFIADLEQSNVIDVHLDKTNSRNLNDSEIFFLKERLIQNPWNVNYFYWKYRIRMVLKIG